MTDGEITKAILKINSDIFNLLLDLPNDKESFKICIDKVENEPVWFQVLLMRLILSNNYSLKNTRVFISWAAKYVGFIL